MQSRNCPNCGSTFLVSDGWAKSAVALLMPAPAVPDMATQVRCPNCHHFFVDGDIRYQGSYSSRRIGFLAVAVCVLLAAWLLYKFFSH